MNTRILEAEYDYVKPDTLEAALGILGEKKNVKVYAGGTDLIVKLKVGADIPMDIMLDINGIGELSEISDNGEALEIGAAAKLSAVERDARVKKDYIALYEALTAMASISVRNMGTIGGNFCNASPVADAVPPVICYGGDVVIRSAHGTRRVLAEEFFTAPGVTVMEKNELLTKVALPAPKPNTGAAFLKLGRVKSDIAKISICAVITRDGDKIDSCRIAMGAVAATPLFLREISDSLSGKTVTRALISETAESISAFIRPIDDNRTTAEYRTEVAKVIAEEVLSLAWSRSGGEIK